MTALEQAGGHRQEGVAAFPATPSKPKADASRRLHERAILGRNPHEKNTVGATTCSPILSASTEAHVKVDRLTATYPGQPRL